MVGVRAQKISEEAELSPLADKNAPSMQNLKGSGRVVNCPPEHRSRLKSYAQSTLIKTGRFIGSRDLIKSLYDH